MNLQALPQKAIKPAENSTIKSSVKFLVFINRFVKIKGREAL